MNQVYGEVLDGALKALWARRSEIDSTMKRIESNPGTISKNGLGTDALDGEIQNAIERLYEIRSLVEDTIVHLTRLARMRN